MKKYRHLFALGLLATFPGAFAQEYRVWTNREARTVEAAFEKLDGAKVHLRLRNGSLAEVPLPSLSDADQKWISEKSAGLPLVAPAAMVDPGAGTEAVYDGPAASSEWPRTVALEEKGGASVIEEDAEKKLFRYESDHYEFVCDSRLGVSTVREFSKVFEAAWLVNCLLPLDFKPRPEPLRKKFLARIYSTKEDYSAAGGTTGSAGVYSRGDKALKLPLASLGVKMVGSRVSIDYGSEDYGTLVHEITHQMMNHWLAKLPTWYTEGAAEYVELAEYSNGRFSFSKHESRLKEQLQRYSNAVGLFRLVPVEKLMTIEGGEWSAALTRDDNTNYPSALALTSFFYHVDGDGKGTHLMAWLRAIENLPRSDQKAIDEALQKHLMRERSYAGIEEELRKYLRKVGVKVADPA